VRFEIGSEFAGYTVVSRLGRGGMATVYLVREPGLERLVALKVLPQQLVDDQQFGPRFEQEARVIGSLDHPHIIPVYRYGITEDVPWMALRYVDGGDFAARLIARPLALAEGFVILRGVASALDYAHRKNIVHRDIKPQNILLSSEGSAYLADFGVAKLLQASTVSHTLIGGIVGSPAYMAPEQAQGHAIGPHTDIYSLAVICFQWLTGSLPFEADTPHAILLKHVLEPLPTDALGVLAPPVAAALQRGMAKKPEDRYPTAGHLIVALEQAMYAPMSNTLDGLPALTPSGLRAVSGFERRLDTPMGLSPPILPPDPRLDTPTRMSRALVEPEPRPAPPAITPPVPPRPVSIPDPALAKTHVTSEPTSRVSEMLQALKPATSVPASGLPSPGDADEGTWARLRRPLAFAALGAALLVAVYFGWRMLSADSDVPSLDADESSTVAEVVDPANPPPSASTPDSPAKDFVELKRELEESDRARAESLAKGPAPADAASRPAQPTIPPVPDPAAEAAEARAEKIRERERQVAEAQRTAREAEAKRIAQEEAARRAAEARAANATTSPDPAPANLPAPATNPVSPPPGPAATVPAPASATAQTASPAAPTQPQTTEAPDRAPAAPSAVVGGFAEKGGGVLTDTRTGNEWSQADNGSSIDWKDAQRHCRKRGSGWRLPNGRELLGIRSGAQSTQCGNNSCGVSRLFDLSSSSFWTSEQRGTTLSMVVYLNTGRAEALPVDRGSPRALCIRKR